MSDLFINIYERSKLWLHINEYLTHVFFLFIFIYFLLLSKYLQIHINTVLDRRTYTLMHTRAHTNKHSHTHYYTKAFMSYISTINPKYRNHHITNSLET